MRGRAKSGKTIDIVLNEEKFYFPGDSLKGTVIVHPKSPTKTNHIIVRFTGQVVLTVKDKENITLFQRTQTIRVSNDDTKVTILEAKQHSFPFHLEVPKGIEIPSTMEFAKKAKVRYILTAIHDRPMVPESFCPKAHYNVPILEYLDIEAPQFKIPQEQTAKSSSLSSKQCQLKVSIPRTGFSRGDIATIRATVTCSESLVITKGLRVDLVRMADIRSGRHRFVKEDILKTSEHDLNIIGPYNFSQAASCQMPIPTSTPPTIGYDGMTLRMYYQIRAKVRLTDIIDKPKTVTLELPIVVGTWPLADIPIDDDDNDGDSLMMSVASDTDDPITTTATSYNTNHQHHHSHSNSSGSNGNGSDKNNTFRMSGDISAFTLHQKNYRNSTSNIALALNVMEEDNNVDRSDSKSSKKSASSWRSNQSWDSQPLSRNTSLTTPDKLASSSFPRNTTSSIIEPSLPPPPQPVPLSNNHNNRNSMQFDHHSMAYYNNNQQQPSSYRHSTFTPLTTIPSSTTASSSPSPPRPYYPLPVAPPVIRMHEDPMGYPSITPPSYSVTQNPPSNIPNHILQPITSSSSSSNNNIDFAQQRSSSSSISRPTIIRPDDTYMTDSSDDSSDDDGDLLRIVRKKKKAEQKRQQQSMHV
ncbi:hypothetical protein BDA99DRAFT_495519 [Phascolomyces articulosus]|uniref:Arrestin C-terminal-like domain-containing protein n=1 Tax=Phascolomyces articulosus TaxID=60185 RepID=A0AAD5K948_9FUNG|nr:hypothetical protein BDA99DRAFT_495519 [Phascolomyces articulosus]